MALYVSLYCNSLRTLNRKGTKEKLTTENIVLNQIMGIIYKYRKGPKTEMRKYYYFKSVLPLKEDCFLLLRCLHKDNGTDMKLPHTPPLKKNAKPN